MVAILSRPRLGMGMKKKVKSQKRRTFFHRGVFTNFSVSFETPEDQRRCFFTPKGAPQTKGKNISIPEPDPLLSNPVVIRRSGK